MDAQWHTEIDHIPTRSKQLGYKTFKISFKIMLLKHKNKSNFKNVLALYAEHYRPWFFLKIIDLYKWKNSLFMDWNTQCS